MTDKCWLVLKELGKIDKNVQNTDLLWIYCFSLHRNVSSLLTASEKYFNSTESLELHDIVMRSFTISTRI